MHHPHTSLSTTNNLESKDIHSLLNYLQIHVTSCSLYGSKVDTVLTEKKLSYCLNILKHSKAMKHGKMLKVLRWCQVESDLTLFSSCYSS